MQATCELCGLEILYDSVVDENLMLHGAIVGCNMEGVVIACQECVEPLVAAIWA